jgi:Arc/MetJ-type ribon-helix-helix transcriptional regulator
VDALVRQRRFANRSQAVEMAVRSTLDRLQRTRLAEACNQLDPDEERALAEEGIAGELAEWPKY